MSDPIDIPNANKSVSEFDKLTLELHQGIKALHNITFAAEGLKLLKSAWGNPIHPIIYTSIYYWAVIRYAKPFLSSKHPKKRSYLPHKKNKKRKWFQQKFTQPFNGSEKHSGCTR